ncbi:TIGR04211 family SH3 domain-containing protein [Microbulbifer sp. CAU 1566]|uniref:TIGR04211 family SH3 domain-containing protein n=1 Tax=unclassified Microbulbifer TaxID=2619833 RepID=UPI0013586A27|nr:MULTISPECIES: TIGR04211 family SH3 domain-containing protein [unclassified Microbulbifer]MCK7595708.1 TIGR04211 family SH3 domain-containing protein [Microbulbifer sp. CAU 1566]
MKRFLTSIAATLITLGASHSQALSSERYITDELHVPMRSGQGNEFRILHRGLPSGTKLTLLQDSPDTGWAQVRTPGGEEGWVRRQYLENEPVAKIKLAQAEARLEHIESLQGNLGGEVRRLEEENGKLTTALKSEQDRAEAMAKELKELKTLSADAVSLNQRHQKLLNQHELLKQKQAMDHAEIQRLSSNDTQKWFMYGAFSVLMGAILALVAPHFRPRKRHSEWAN